MQRLMCMSTQFCNEGVDMTMSPAAIRSEIKAALRAGDMERAWTWVSRIVGNRIVAGDIAVKLKRHRL